MAKMNPGLFDKSYVIIILINIHTKQKQFHPYNLVDQQRIGHIIFGLLLGAK